MVTPLLIARHEDIDLALLPALANRHGLITGATGTGKTITLQLLAERFSAIGVPVFMADVKGDLSGLAAPGSLTPKLQARLDALGRPTTRRRNARSPSGMCSARRDIRCARRSRTWGRCCWRGC
jgi:hypothetical protein